MKDFKQYRRKQIAELRDVTEEEVLEGLSRDISISSEDKKNGSPKPGDKIARNPKNHKDQWLVAQKYAQENFEAISEEKLDKSMLKSLKYLIDNNNQTESPDQISFGTKHYEYLIGIGKDHTASIILDEDALKALKEIVPD